MGLAGTKFFTEILAKNIAKPSNSLGGYIVGHMFKTGNRAYERNAVKLCNIQPHYHVLEVGFGPGVGLRYAYNCVKDGKGMVYGVDISDKMLRDATKSMKEEIAAGKVALYPNSVTDLPFNDNSMDCIFHCNCYYFWPDMDLAVTELYRVIKHDGILVTTLSIDRLKDIRERGIMKYGNIEPSRYMDSLRKSGFVNIKYEDTEDKNLGFKIQAITAAAHKPVE